MNKNILYSITCLAFTIIIGGAVYEHLNVVPTWAAAPPVSLSMFKGEYGLNPALFWQIIHPVNLLLFALTLIFHWNTQRRKSIVFVFSSYFIILVITAIYFVPELISITNTASDGKPDPALMKRASLWEMLSLLRLAVLVFLALKLYLGLTKNTSNLSQLHPNLS